jgi:hypothetical protein
MKYSGGSYCGDLRRGRTCGAAKRGQVFSKSQEPRVREKAGLFKTCFFTVCFVSSDVCGCGCEERDAGCGLASPAFQWRFVRTVKSYANCRTKSTSGSAVCGFGLLALLFGQFGDALIGGNAQGPAR